MAQGTKSLPYAANGYLCPGCLQGDLCGLAQALHQRRQRVGAAGAEEAVRLRRREGVAEVAVAVAARLRP